MQALLVWPTVLCVYISGSVPVSFDFGKQFGWEAVSVYVLLGDGDVILFCPVIPPGM